MLDEEEHFQEQLFERLRYYGENEKELDFWLVIEPKFLDKFPNITQRLRRPAVALVSTNGPWITLVRLDPLLILIFTKLHPFVCSSHVLFLCYVMTAGS